MCGHQILRGLKGPHALTNGACPYLCRVRIPPLLMETAASEDKFSNNAAYTRLKLVPFEIYSSFAIFNGGEKLVIKDDRRRV